MHYVKDIFQGKETEHAHKKFVRYSKGEFTGPLIKIKITKANVKVNGSFHLIDELLSLMAEHLENREIEIKGTLAWNKDLSPELAKSGIKYLKVLKSRGIFNYTLNNVVQFKNFVDNMSEFHLLVSFKNDDTKLSTKAKFPKPNKEIINDFCKAIFPRSMASRILSEFAFDVKDKNPKDIIITNKIFIEDIILPKVDSFEEARKLAKRKGIMKRIVQVDDKPAIESEIKFSV